MVKLYTDGSFNIYTNTYGSGLIYVKDDIEIEERKFSGNDPALAKSRQIPGELMAVIYGLNIAIRDKEKEVTIYYDYEGIEKWALNKWKTNKTLTANYKDFIQDAMKKIKINFVWVKSHVGNKMEERVDLLAKEACGVI